MDSAQSPYNLRTKIHYSCINLPLPSLFITNNQPDIHNAVILNYAGADLDLDNVLSELLDTGYECAQIIATHPVATTKAFNKCLIKSFLKSLLLGSVLGLRKEYFCTVANRRIGDRFTCIFLFAGNKTFKTNNSVKTS